MKLVIIFGPHAVGKMTVGQELAKITRLRLFHNHMTIEPVCGLFDDMPDEFRRLVSLFRKEIFEAYSKSDQYGMIFTYMCAFDDEHDWKYLMDLEALFASRGADVYYVELEADYELRIARNKTENRLMNKASKRNLAWSENMFRTLEDRHRLNSLPGEIDKENYIRIDNTELSPEYVAEMIRDRFDL